MEPNLASNRTLNFNAESAYCAVIGSAIIDVGEAGNLIHAISLFLTEISEDIENTVDANDFAESADLNLYRDAVGRLNRPLDDRDRQTIEHYLLGWIEAFKGDSAPIAQLDTKQIHKILKTTNDSNSFILTDDLFILSNELIPDELPWEYVEFDNTVFNDKYTYVMIVFNNDCGIYAPESP